MARRVNVLLLDDLDESQAAETVVFGLDGSTYEIDLNDEHVAEFREAVTPYVAAARRAGAGGAPQRRRAARGSSPTPTSGERASNGQDGRVQDVREWARANGHTVSDRGRLSAAVQEAYTAAHS